MFLGTRDGLSIRFNEADVREIGRTGKGVIGMRLDEGTGRRHGDRARRLHDPDGDRERLSGKRSTLDDYRSQGRGGKGIITIKTTEKNGRVVGMAQVSEEDEILLITSNGKILRPGPRTSRSRGGTPRACACSKRKKETRSSLAKVVERETRRKRLGLRRQGT